jgi:hypothetical protein
MKHIETVLALTEFVVEASSFEKQTLWSSHKHLNWIDSPFGRFIHITEIDNRPVTILFTISEINDLIVLFWSPSSQLVDYKAIEEWFIKNCNPLYDNDTQRANTNAMRT